MCFEASETLQWRHEWILINIVVAAVVVNVMVVVVVVSVVSADTMVKISHEQCALSSGKCPHTCIITQRFWRLNMKLMTDSGRHLWQ